VAQAHALARLLRGLTIDAAYASDLSRALDTATIALAGRRLPITSLVELRERDYGAWDGMHDDEIPVRFPDEFARWEAGASDGAANAESYAASAERVGRVLPRIGDAHPAGTVLLVSHSGPVKVLHCLAHGFDYVRDRRSIPDARHGVLAQYELRGGRLIVS